jgi:hypothetical protein
MPWGNVLLGMLHKTLKWATADSFEMCPGTNFKKILVDKAPKYITISAENMPTYWKTRYICCLQFINDGVVEF